MDAADQAGPLTPPASATNGRGVNARGVAVGIAWFVIVGAVCFGLLVAARAPMLVDSAWLLWLARSTLHGAVVYRDLWEINPPLSHWLLFPPAVVIEVANWPSRLAFNVYLVAWCGGAVLVVTRLWRHWSIPPAPVSTAGAVSTLALLALPGPFFGQREHFLLAAALPWLVVVALWRAGDEAPLRLESLAAVGVACAVALKPFYVGWWLMAPLVTRRSIHRPAYWLVPTLGVVYLGLVACTNFPSYAGKWAAVYWQYFHRPWWFVAVGNPFSLLALGSVAITVKTTRHTALGVVIGAATLAAWAGSVVQGKALAYHFFPAAVLALLLLTYAGPSTRRTLVLPLGLAWVAYIGYYLLVSVPSVRRAAVALDRAAGPAPAMVLSATADHGWMLTSEFDRPWLSTQLDLWWLAISRGSDTLRGFPRWREQNEELRHGLITAHLPPVLFLSEDGVDVGEYLLRSAEWRDSLANYRRGEVVAGYRIWRRVR